MAKFTILEPMSAGDVIDRAVRLYRRNFTPLLAIVAVPSLVGYLTNTMFWFGYSRLVLGSMESGGQATFSAVSILMLIAGIILYPVWLFVMFFTISGMVRVVGDHIMLGEAITFRKCFTTARHRLGDIFLMCLLFIAILIGLYTIFAILFFIIAIVLAFLVGATASSGLPPWVIALVTVILSLAVVGAGIAVGLIVLSRVIFIPQIVMIEGQSPGAAFSRAMQLGKGNWYKLGAIILFTYFVSLSLLAALTLPVLAVLYSADILSADFILSPSWNIVYTSFSQLSSMLCLPIWFICFTLLYFDSRVRKEAYDIELLAREVNPGFYWQPQPMVMGYQIAGPMYTGRNFVQTSPLGLAGWRPNPPPMPPQPGFRPMPPPPPNWGQTPPPQPSFPQPLPANGGNPGNQRPEAPVRSEVKPSAQLTAPMANEQQEEFVTSPANHQPVVCKVCGTALEPNARFCIRCGSGG